MTKDPAKAGTKELRVFGLGLGVIFSVFALLAWRKSGVTAPYWLAAGSIMAALGWLKPMSLLRVYIPWMRVVGVIGAANAFLLMAVVFYVIVTPYRFIAKLMGKDLLDLRMRTGDSYWKPREPSQGPASYERQF